MTSSLVSGRVFALSREEIICWVAEKLSVEADYPMPETKIGPRQELQNVFSRFSEKSTKRWVEYFQEGEADKMMARYLGGVVGLFVPETKIIVLHKGGMKISEKGSHLNQVRCEKKATPKTGCLFHIMAEVHGNRTHLTRF